MMEKKGTSDQCKREGPIPDVRAIGGKKHVSLVTDGSMEEMFLSELRHARRHTLR